MANRVCVIDLPALSRPLLAAMPESSRLAKWIRGKAVRTLVADFPAVTCPVQATLTTGTPPSRHGIIANGLPTFRFPGDQALVDASNFASYRREISFWEQSNQFLEANRFWQDVVGRSRWKTALLFFQHSMPGFAGTLRSAADIVLTPRPQHGPDGKITSLCWSHPADLVDALFSRLGPFPLMNYWGPMASLASSLWIARAAAYVWKELRPQLQWVYVPHLDYDLQRFGPSAPQAGKAAADVAAALDGLMDALLDDGAIIVLLSEYSMQDVNGAVFPNRLLAEAGLLRTRVTGDGQLIDYQRSGALAMVDHQIAHVYAANAAEQSRAKAALAVEGVGIIDPPPDDCRHRRSGDFVLQAQAGTWLDYRWWSRPEEAPLFAATVDIHRKCGYDPLELIFDPQTRGVQQDARLVRGSHGAMPGSEGILISDMEGDGEIRAREVARLISGGLSGR